MVNNFQKQNKLPIRNKISINFTISFSCYKLITSGGKKHIKIVFKNFKSTLHTHTLSGIHAHTHAKFIHVYNET